MEFSGGIDNRPIAAVELRAVRRPDGTFSPSKGPIRKTLKGSRIFWKEPVKARWIEMVLFADYFERGGNA